MRHGMCVGGGSFGVLLFLLVVGRDVWWRMAHGIFGETAGFGLWFASCAVCMFVWVGVKKNPSSFLPYVTLLPCVIKKMKAPLPCRGGWWGLGRSMLNFVKNCGKLTYKISRLQDHFHKIFFPWGRCSTMTPTKNRVRTRPCKKLGLILPILTLHPHNVLP